VQTSDESQHILFPHFLDPVNQTAFVDGPDLITYSQDPFLQAANTYGNRRSGLSSGRKRDDKNGTPGLVDWGSAYQHTRSHFLYLSTYV
jgi:hypothetical protein